MWATEDFIVHGAGVSMSFVFAWVPLVPLRSLSSNMEWLRPLTLGCTNSWGTLSLGNSQSYKGTANKHTQLCPRRKHYLYYPGQEINLPSAQEGDPISIFQGSIATQKITVQGSLISCYEQLVILVLVMWLFFFVCVFVFICLGTRSTLFFRRNWSRDTLLNFLSWRDSAPQA